MNPLGPASIEEDVYAEQVRYLYNNAPRSIPFNVINPAILLLVFWPVARHDALLWWFSGLLVVSVARFLHVGHVRSRGDSGATAKALAWHFIVGSTATAVLWGAGFVIVGTAFPTPFRLLYLLTLGGMAAGAFASMGTHRVCYLLFLAGLFVPVFLTLTFHQAQFSVVVVILVTLFSVMLAVTHGVTHGMLVDGIRNKIENEVLVQRLEQTNAKLEAANAELETSVKTDSLTGIPNRLHFERRFSEEWQRARRNGDYVACLLIDVDHFKQFNDLYGHVAGDDCLRRIAAVLDEQLMRPSDFVARYGGEEFLVLLPGTDAEGAEVIAKRLNEAVEDLAIHHVAGSASRYVTVSVGVAAALPERLSDKSALVKAADEALYRAKRQGRNRVVLSRRASSNAA